MVQNKGNRSLPRPNFGLGIGIPEPARPLREFTSEGVTNYK